MFTVAHVAPQHENTPCSSVSAFTLFYFRVALQDFDVSRYRLAFRKEIIKLRCSLSICSPSQRVEQKLVDVLVVPCLKQPVVHPGVFILPWDSGDLRFGVRSLSLGVL